MLKLSFNPKIMKKYKRILMSDLVGGVLSGTAYYFGIQTWIVRTIFTMLAISEITIFSSIFLIFLYMVIVIFAPEYEEDPLDYKEICEG